MSWTDDRIGNWELSNAINTCPPKNMHSPPDARKKQISDGKQRPELPQWKLLRAKAPPGCASEDRKANIQCSSFVPQAHSTFRRWTTAHTAHQNAGRFSFSFGFSQKGSSTRRISRVLAILVPRAISSISESHAVAAAPAAQAVPTATDSALCHNCLPQRRVSE
jgi:hypothetical protein